VRKSALFDPMMRTSFAATSMRWASARKWPPDPAGTHLRAWLAKVLIACGVMLGPADGPERDRREGNDLNLVRSYAAPWRKLAKDGDPR
jgi:hypothetical protein